MPRGLPHQQRDRLCLPTLIAQQGTVCSSAVFVARAATSSQDQHAGNSVLQPYVQSGSTVPHANPYDLSRLCWRLIGAGGGGHWPAYAERRGCSDYDGQPAQNPARLEQYVYGMRPSWALFPAEPEEICSCISSARQDDGFSFIARFTRVIWQACWIPMTVTTPIKPIGSVAQDLACPKWRTGSSAAQSVGGDWGGAFPYEDGIDATSRRSIARWRL